jgi:predicted nucleotidyltransferase
VPASSRSPRADWPEFRPTRLLRRLVESGVDFVVIGGFAAIAHGSVQLTRDLDICYSTEAPNLEALGLGLVDLGARLRGVTDDVPFAPDAATLRRTRVVTLETEEGPLDVLADPAGAPGYETLKHRALEVPVAGVLVRVASLEDLLAMKRASGRPKDLLAIEELEAIARLASE